MQHNYLHAMKKFYKNPKKVQGKSSSD